MTVDLLSPDEATLQISVTDFSCKDGMIFYVVETNVNAKHCPCLSMNDRKRVHADKL